MFHQHRGLLASEGFLEPLVEMMARLSVIAMAEPSRALERASGANQPEVALFGSADGAVVCEEDTGAG